MSLTENVNKLVGQGALLSSFKYWNQPSTQLLNKIVPVKGKQKLKTLINLSKMHSKKVKLSENENVAVIDSDNDDDNASESPPVSVNYTVTFELEFWEKIWNLEQQLSSELMKIDFKKDKNIAAVYNPLEYAADVHKNFMQKYLKKAPIVLFLGMNPGLYGMCQTSASDSNAHQRVY